MPKFTTELVKSIKAREDVEQLLINGDKVLDIFGKELAGTTYIKEFDRILHLVQHVADGGNFGNICKIVKGKNNGVMEFEFRTPNLRLFAIQQPGKKIIIYGGKKRKADSSDLITNFRNIKNAYLESIKNNK